MENELSRVVVDALPGLVWTALPDGRIDFLNQRWCDTPGLALRKPLALTKPMPGAGRLRSTPKTCPSSSIAGDPFGLPASQVKWKRACGASMESIAGSSSVLVRQPKHPDRSSNGAE
jgi:hypothetical protein